MLIFTPFLLIPTPSSPSNPATHIVNDDRLIHNDFEGLHREGNVWLEGVAGPVHELALLARHPPEHD